MEGKKRDYAMEYARDNQKVKKYVVRIAKYQSEAFEEKAKELGKRPTTLLTEITKKALDNFLQKS